MALVRSRICRRGFEILVTLLTGGPVFFVGKLIELFWSISVYNFVKETQLPLAT